MNAVLRPAIVVVVVIPLVVSLLGLRFACHSTGLRKIIQSALRDEELEQSHRAAYHRIDAREETVRELIAQRCSLSQALARFEELDGEHPDDLMELSRERNGYDSERNYQYIVELVKDLLENQTEKAAIVLRRLEKEYQQLRAGRNVPLAMPTKRTKRSR
jgi:hypothetical protein